MKFGPQNHHRRSIRLPEYDYTQPGAYFVTLCTWGRQPLFGEIDGGVMRLSAVGRIVAAEWQRMGRQFKNIRLDAFVVMPNHVHGIIVIDHPVGARRDPIGATRLLPNGVLSGNEPQPRYLIRPGWVARTGKSRWMARSRRGAPPFTHRSPVWHGFRAK